MATLKSLQALRAIAALLVVMYHTEAIFHGKLGFRPLFGLFGDGSRGVDLFFVLSGFIIAYIHVRDWDRPSRTANYLFNRFSRIYPSVWIVTLLAVPLYAAGFGGADKSVKLSLSNFVTSAFLLPQHTVALVNVTWTLKYEIFFYLVFTLLILNKRFGSVILILWQIAVVAVSIFGINYEKVWGGFYLRPICIEFGMGVLCALLVMRAKDWSFVAASAQFWTLIVGVIAFTGCTLVETYPVGHGSRLPDAAFGLSACLILVSLVMLESAGRLRVSNVLVMLGDASYAMYLVHFSVISLLVALLAKLHHRVPENSATALIVAAAAVVVGVGFDRFVDRPIQRALRDAKPRILGRIGRIPVLRNAE